MTHRTANRGLALLLAAATMLSIPERARAQHFPGSMVQVGPWTLVASAASRSFSRCTIRRVQADGLAVYIGLTPGGVQFFGMSAPRWELKPRQPYPISLTVGSRQFTFSGMATSVDALNIDAAPEFFAALPSARQISVSANQRHFTMDLDGFEVATTRLKDCVKEYDGRTLPATAAPPIPAPPPGTVPTSPPPASRTGDGKPIVVRVAPRPAYPDGSRLAGEEGTAIIKVTFDVQGIPEIISVETSSGYPALDQAATDAAKEMRIEPFKKDGNPTRAVLVIPMRFNLVN